MVLLFPERPISCRSSVQVGPDLRLSCQWVAASCSYQVA